jgi:thiamine-phosphate pyrophosphorylase
LGFDAMSPGEAASLLPPGALIGVSAHSPAEVASAAETGAGYAHLAPIWDPRSKPATRPALGLEALREASAAGLTLLAQGGLTADRCPQALASGATGIAVTGDVLLADDPAAATRALRSALDS